MSSALMLMATCSNAGKSLLATGLCRALARRGLRTRPFKPQNMSNNAAVTEDGGEIGRAQALQARACGVPPHSRMNPILLKPQGDSSAQLILRGRLHATLSAREWHARAREFLPPVLESYRALRAAADIVIVEGAGSPAEANLRRNDIANMGFARAAGVPALLIGDIERGGVLASLVGTTALLEAGDRALLRGFIVNRFRGDPRLFAEGMGIIERETGLPPLGLVPFLPEAARLPDEDSLALEARAAAPSAESAVRIAVPRLERMANFDDFDPLRAEPGVDLVFIPPGAPLPGDAAAVILPGSKSTRADLDFLRRQGWDVDLRAHLRRGGHILGLCAGYQMLGVRVIDEEGIEGAAGVSEGLSLLPAETVLRPRKITRLARGRDIVSGCEIHGYEIHIGETRPSAGDLPAMLTLETPRHRAHGMTSRDGLVSGCYIHGLFASDAFRRAWLNRLRPGAGGGLDYERRIEETLDLLADHLEKHMDMEALLRIASCASPE